MRFVDKMLLLLLLCRQKPGSNQPTIGYGLAGDSRRAGLPNDASVHDSVHLKTAAIVYDVASDIAI
jgi:hypothetical protein